MRNPNFETSGPLHRRIVELESEVAHLSGNLTLAEQGLASARKEIERLHAEIVGIQSAHAEDYAEGQVEINRLRAVIDSRDKALGFVELPTPVEPPVQHPVWSLEWREGVEMPWKPYYALYPTRAKARAAMMNAGGSAATEWRSYPLQRIPDPEVPALKSGAGE